MSSIAMKHQPVDERTWISLIRTDLAIRSLAILGAMIVALYVIVRPSGDSETILTNAIFTIVSGGAGLLCLRTAHRLGNAGRPWQFFGFGCIAWFLGQMVWNWYDIVLWTTVPYPSLADIGYAGFYPFMLIGLALLVRNMIGELPAAEIVLDSLIVVTAGALIAYEVFLSSFNHTDSLSTPALVVTLAWEVSSFGLIMLTALALIIRTDLLTRGPLGLLLAGFVAFAAANLVYGRLALNKEYAVGALIDLGWQLGFLCFGIAALVAAQANGIPTLANEHHGPRRAALARMALTVLSVAITTGISAYAATHPNASPVIVILVLLAGGLLALRLGYAALQTEHLARRTRERDRMTGVVAASNAISSTLDLDQILPLLASAAADSVGRSRAEVYVFSEDMTRVENSAVVGFSDAESRRLSSLIEAPIGAYPAEQRVIESLKPSPQSISEPGIPADDAQMFAEIGKLHTLVTPLIAHGRVLGVFDAWTPFDATPFEAADVAAAAAVGQQAGLAIHNARLLARSRQHATEQAALLRVSQAAVSSLDLDAVLAEIAQASLGVANAEACAIEIWDKEQGDTVLAAESTIDAWPGTSAIGKRISFDDWPVSRRVLQEQVTLNMLATDPELTTREQEHLRADDTNSILLVPLVVNGQSLGILNLFSRNSRRFSPDEVRLASDLAAQISIAIDRARLHEALRERADTDGLTDVLNHRAILETLDAEVARARRGGPPFSVLMVDLDGFKQINDTHGHQAGDQMLRETAAFLRSSIRDIDYAGRYGGDEFLLILPNTDTDGARQIATRLLDLAEDATIVIDGQRFPIQISAGIATTPEDGFTRQEILAVADTRMYESKSARRWILAGAQG